MSLVKFRGTIVNKGIIRRRMIQIGPSIHNAPWIIEKTLYDVKDSEINDPENIFRVFHNHSTNLSEGHKVKGVFDTNKNIFTNMCRDEPYYLLSNIDRVD